MKFERGMMSRLPFAATGAADGRPVVVLAGVYPMTGVAGDIMAGSMIPPAGRLVHARRVHVINRFPNIPDDSTMSDLARIHAEAFRMHFGGPVDIVGCSTGGSIAQQIASEHPDVVRRLVLASTAYTLDDKARRQQIRVAEHIDAGNLSSAAASFAAEMVPSLLRSPAALTARTLWRTIFPTRQAARDLSATLHAEDGFDISSYPTITAPTLLVGGAEDMYYPVELFRRTIELIPGSTLELVRGRGHVSVLSDSRAQRRVRDFLSD